MQKNAMLKNTWAALAIALLLVVGRPAVAQQQGGASRFGGGSLFGGGGGQSGFGQSGFGQSSFGQSGFGQSGFGQNAFGQVGGLQGLGGGQNNTGFVGRDGGDTAAFFQQLGRGSNQFFQRLDRSFGRNANRGRGADVTQERRPPVQVQLRLGFRPPAASPQLAGESLGRIARSLATKGYEATVSIDNGVAVLEGTVPAEADRRLAARIARLEPGVSRVDNRLTVAEDQDGQGELIPRAPRT